MLHRLNGKLALLLFLATLLLCTVSCSGNADADSPTEAPEQENEVAVIEGVGETENQLVEEAQTETDILAEPESLQPSEIGLTSTIAPPLTLDKFAVWQDENKVSFAFVIENDSVDFVNKAQYAIRFYDQADVLIESPIPAEIRGIVQEDSRGFLRYEFDFPIIGPNTRTAVARQFELPAGVNVARAELEVIVGPIETADSERPRLLVNSQAFFTVPEDCGMFSGRFDCQLFNRYQQPIAENELNIGVVALSSEVWQIWREVAVQIDIYDLKGIKVASENHKLGPVTRFEPYPAAIIYRTFPLALNQTGLVDIYYDDQARFVTIGIPTLGAANIVVNDEAGELTAKQLLVPDLAEAFIWVWDVCRLPRNESYAEFQQFLADLVTVQLIAISYDETGRIVGFSSAPYEARSTSADIEFSLTSGRLTDATEIFAQYQVGETDYFNCGAGGGSQSAIGTEGGAPVLLNITPLSSANE